MIPFTTSLFNSLTKSVDALLKSEEFKNLKKTFFDTAATVIEEVRGFSVEVPFNCDKSASYEYQIHDGKLYVSVSYNRDNSFRSEKTEVTIPENCDTDSLRVFEAKNKLIFTMKKKNPQISTEILDKLKSVVPIPKIKFEEETDNEGNFNAEESNPTEEGIEGLEEGIEGLEKETEGTEENIEGTGENIEVTEGNTEGIEENSSIPTQSMNIHELIDRNTERYNIS